VCEFSLQTRQIRFNFNFFRRVLLIPHSLSVGFGVGLR
jgi:hypothetical protein